MKRWIRSASLIAGAMAYGMTTRDARAEADTFGLGTGHTGPITITAANTIVNAYEVVTANVATSAVTITVANGATFAPDDLVMVWQTTGLASPPVSGDQTPLDLSTIGMGSFEFARVKSVTGNVVTVTNPIVSTFGYVGAFSQLVKVPEYTTVTIQNTGSIAAGAWTGAKGGIAIFFATGAVVNDGTIQADSAGFRGGALENQNTVSGCTALDGPSGLVGGALAGGAHKGEGLYPSLFSTNANSATATYGRGNITVGGGGGDCHNAGGGGGGHGGTGGGGSITWSGDGSRAVGGFGGAALDYSILTRLSLGGGGGAGHENDNVGSAGGNGGGVVVVRANALSGAGSITADGATSENSNNDGAGGGGAGGAILLLVSTAADCAAVHANGGAGGSCAAAHGPGAGGAGGVVMVQAASGACSAKSTTDAGAAGLAGGVARGSAAGTSGTTPVPPTGGFLPTPCDPTVNKCGGCVTAIDCPSLLPVCDSSANQCVGCLADIDCTDPTKKRCNLASKTCVACISNTDCPTGETCDETAGTCGAPDADGGIADGGNADSGDGGRSDGGVATDGGAFDGGSAMDGGYGRTNDDGSLEGGGLSCTQSTRGQSSNTVVSLGLLALGLSFFRRRRR